MTTEPGVSSDAMSEALGLSMTLIGFAALVAGLVASYWFLGLWSRRQSPQELQPVPFVALILVVMYLTLQVMAVFIAVAASGTVGWCVPGAGDDLQWLNMACNALVLPLVPVLALVFLQPYGGSRVLGMFECRKAALSGFLGLLAFYPVYLGVAILVTALIALLGLDPSAQHMVDLAHRNLLLESPAVLGVLAPVAVIGAPLAEEVIFRGVLYRLITQAFGHRAGMVLSGFAFGAIHGNVAAFVPLAVLGMFLAHVYARTGNLFVPIFVHAFFNALTVGFLVVMTLAGV